MKIATFKNQSTFSHVGRHAAELRYLLSSLDYAPQKILEVGSGCLEPIYFAQLLPLESTLYALDIDSEISGVLEKLIVGRKIKLTDLAELVCNKNDDGTSRINTDLTDPSLLAKGLEELKMAGLNPSDFFQNGYYQKPSGGATIISVNDEVSSYCSRHQEEFDLVYAGAVILNLAKVFSKEKLVKTVKDILGSLKGGKVLGVGTNPAGLFAEKNDVSTLEESGASVTELLVDNLVKVKMGETYKLFGGHYLSAARAEDERYSCLSKEVIAECIAKNHFLTNAGIVYTEIKGNHLGNYLVNQKGELLIAALRKEDGYKGWTANLSKLERLLPEMERKSFGLIPILEQG